MSPSIAEEVTRRIIASQPHRASCRYCGLTEHVRHCSTCGRGVDVSCLHCTPVSPEPGVREWAYDPAAFAKSMLNNTIKAF